VLQHICLYCSGSAENNYDNSTTTTTTTESSGTYWNVPVTEPPRSRKRSEEVGKDSFAPSAPPADDEEEGDPLLCPDPNEDDLRDFSAGMSVMTSSNGGRVKVNCCNALLKQCLELIDVQASGVLASEDIEDLDISAINMIICRDTLSIGRETEVFGALMRWSTRECKRQRLELTAANRRNVLEGVNFTNILQAAFLYKSVYKAFFYLQFGFLIFLA
jgi:hypothetical protein